ncbi:DUF2975 domain-containing protein [Fodinibius halophilus]|uniref:DUF2975 domain-containing protein n=1 Tax=Fodinibius halophilus TaxID=1736908 RepID=A0A6M1T0N4_9BACT|nr:DUF2975 domain-containing protein [Fodinibius halophilus]NGP87499.1 DUF2975 domain-containing protein [Fodinibius halophilus]
MDLQSNIIKESNFRWLVLSILALMVLFYIYLGINSIQTFHRVYDNSPPSAQTATYEIGDLTLSKTTVVQQDTKRTVRYITTDDLSYTPSQKKTANILQAQTGLTKIMGLSGNPSFLVTEEHESFWKSQFYYQIAFYFGGFLIFALFLIGVTEINFRQEKKLFTKEIKRFFGGIYALFITAFFIKAVLYGRMVHFLNNEYYLGESLTGGVSSSLLSIAVALLFIFLFLERAIKLQKEQDLTI